MWVTYFRPLLASLFCLGLQLWPLQVSAQETAAFVPAPAFLETRDGFFSWNRHTRIYSNADYRSNNLLRNYLKKYYDVDLKIHKVPFSVNQSIFHKKNRRGKTDPSEKLKDCIILAYDSSIVNRDFYTMDITERNTVIKGNLQGIFYGIQSLLQLLPVKNNAPASGQPTQQKPGFPFRLPLVNVIDSARFPYRGMHLDVSRHFFTVEQVKKYIDYLSFHKLNTFHWHLTDDQGWRIEIKKYPRLTEAGSCRDQTLVGQFGSDSYDRKRYCGFYTQDAIRDIVQYASDRYITIIPEIEMPGHCAAALAAYPFLGCTKGPYKVMETWGVFPESFCAGNDSTYRFMEEVLDEVFGLFPSSFIHIGGDECDKSRWETCPACLKKMKDNGMKGVNELQASFVTNIARYAESKGRRIIGWDEILDGNIPASAAIMSWRGTSGGIAAAKKSHIVIMTPESPLYFNHSQSINEDSVTQGGYNPIENVYAYDPIPETLDAVQSAFIIGAQGNMWTEYIDNEKKLAYMLFPRLSAFSETVWTPVKKKNWESFERRLTRIMERYKFWGAGFSQAYYDIRSVIIPSVENRLEWKLETRNQNGKLIWKNDSSADKVFNYTSPVPINSSGNYGAAMIDSANHVLSDWYWQAFNINQATGKKIKLISQPDPAYSFGGAFTLVDGVRNKKGMAKSIQFLGFWGRDLEAIIDLGETKQIKNLIINIFEQNESWIYKPTEVSFFKSDDGQHFQLLGNLTGGEGSRHLTYNLPVRTEARFIKILAKNAGTIPSGKPGAGNQAWLFADEIEIW
jgi:hexosaminidase